MQPFFNILYLYQKNQTMKKITLLATAAFISIVSFAQARLTTADYQKVMQPALEIEVPFVEKTVMKTVVDKLEKQGYKSSNNKGYTVFKSVRMAELGPDSYDLYFKTDRKSRKEKDATILTMMISGGYEKFIGDSTNSPLIANAKEFLNKQIEASAAYDLELQIADQEDVSKKADKRLANLIEDGQDLQKKKEKIERDIEENIKKQADQKAEAEKQLQIFNTLKSKRKQ